MEKVQEVKKIVKMKEKYAVVVQVDLESSQ